MAPPNARSARASLLITALTTLSVLPVVSAQQLLQYGNGQLPTCATGCTLLNQAQAACVPPAAPNTNQATYQSCFCQSAYLRTFYQSPNGVCDAECGQSDLVQIQKWYTGLCKNGAAATIAPSSSTSAPASSSTSPVATASPTTTVGLPQDTQNKSWYVSSSFSHSLLLLQIVSIWSLVFSMKPWH